MKESGMDVESNSTSSPPDRWSLRTVRWGAVFSRQDYANIFCSILLVIALSVVNFVAEPRHTPYFLYDATISYPHLGSPTVPSWVPFVVPFIMLIATVVVGELIYSRWQHHNLTDCIATMIYFILDGVQSFIFTIFMTIVTKMLCGRLRPDFLARCNPNVSNMTNQNELFWGEDVTNLYPCQDGGSTLKDGYLSFPSGHSSTGFSLAVYASSYLIWCFHMRKPWNPEMRHWTFWRKFLSDVGNICAKYWMLAMLMFAWGVALSRVIDFQHNYSDILGGAFLGTLVAIVYALRAIPRYKRVLSPEALEDAKVLERASLSVGRPSLSSEPAAEAAAAEAGLLQMGGGHSSLRPTRSGSRVREGTVSPSELAV